MPTPVIINTAAIQYAQGVTECHCVITADTVVGPTTVSQVVVVDSTTLAEDWTDADLAAHSCGHSRGFSPRFPLGPR